MKLTMTRSLIREPHTCGSLKSDRVIVSLFYDEPIHEGGG